MSQLFLFILGLILGGGLMMQEQTATNKRGQLEGMTLYYKGEAKCETLGNGEIHCYTININNR